MAGAPGEKASAFSARFSSPSDRRRVRRRVSKRPDSNRERSAADRRNCGNCGSIYEDGVRRWLVVSLHPEPGGESGLSALVSEPEVQKLPRLEAHSPGQTLGAAALCAPSL